MNLYGGLGSHHRWRPVFLFFSCYSLSLPFSLMATSDGSINQGLNRKSKIVEQFDEDDSFSFKSCIDKLISLPDVTAEQLYVGGQALKSREERIFFMTVPPSTIEFWLDQRVKEFRRKFKD